MAILRNTGIVLSATIAQEYEINYAAKLDQFSTEFATAYDAKPKVPAADRTEYYALIFNKFFPADLDRINSYKEAKDDNLQTLMDFGRVNSPKGEALCCIMKKPGGQRLSDIIKQRQFEENFVVTHIFGLLFHAISALHDKDIMHGNINMDNVYIDGQTANVTVRECLSELIGFSQKPGYDTFERMVCHPAAKSKREYSADYYSTGVLVAGLISGADIFGTMPASEVIRTKFEFGSFDTVVSRMKNNTLLPKTEILLRGLLHDKIKERWQEKQINGWQRKESTQPSPSRMHRQAASPFIFMDRDYYGAKYLAYVLQQNWIEAKKSLKLAELIRWISFTSRLPDIEKRMSMMMSRSGQTEIVLPDEKLARTIYLLDEEGPIRFKNISFHPDGLGNLFAYFLMKNDQLGLDQLSSIIDMGFIEGWINQQENQDMYRGTMFGYNPKKIKTYLRKNELGFGTERCLYELNPYLPCLSPLLDNTYAIGLPSVLTALNQGRLNGKDIENDRHLTSYIFYQTEIEDALKIKSLQPFPYFYRSMAIKLCGMFALAQQRSGIDKLPGIALWLRQNLNPVLEMFNSVNLRRNVTEKLDLAVATGDINKIFAVITDARMIRKDVYGFMDAKKTFKILNFEMLKLKSQHNLDQLAFRMGLRVAVIFSYLICSIAILSIVVLHF